MTLHDKISGIVVNRMKTSPYFAERTADAILKLPEISDLQKKLAEVKLRSENIHTLWLDACSRSGESQIRAKAAEARIAELERQHTLDVIDAVNAQASSDNAITRAYQMGLEAAADQAEHERNSRGAGRNTDGLWTVITTIRAMQPPADLVERAKGPKP